MTDHVVIVPVPVPVPESGSPKYQRPQPPSPRESKTPPNWPLPQKQQAGAIVESSRKMLDAIRARRQG